MYIHSVAGSVFIVYNPKMTCIWYKCWLGHQRPHPNFFSLFQLYNSHFATRQICLRCTIITMIPWLKFTINDERGVSVFSFLGLSGPVENINFFSWCCKYPSGGIIPLPFVQIYSSKDDPSVCGKVSDMILKAYVKSNNFFSKV